MRIEPFEYVRPATVKEACAVLTEQKGNARLLAGGTDLVPRLKQQIIRPGLVLDMADVQEFGYIRGDASGLAIGAGTSLHTLVTSAVIREQAPALAEAAGRVASQQIRNMATLGGNLCLETRCWYFNQSHQWKKAKSPCFKAGGEICHVVNKPGECFATFQGDTAPALLALGATVKIVSSRQEMTIPLGALYSGKGQTPLTLAPDDVLAEVQIPTPPARTGAVYMKYSHRKAVDFPLASVAVSLTLSPDGNTCQSARIALSGVGSAPVHATDAEVILTGQALAASLIDEAAVAAMKAARPVKNVHFGQPATRRKMVGILTKLAIEEAISRAATGSNA